MWIRFNWIVIFFLLGLLPYPILSRENELKTNDNTYSDIAFNFTYEINYTLNTQWVKQIIAGKPGFIICKEKAG